MNEQTDLEYWVMKFMSDELDQRRADVIYVCTGVDMNKCQVAAKSIREMEAARGFVAPYNTKDTDRIDRALKLLARDPAVNVHKLWLIEFLKAWLASGKLNETDNAPEETGN